MAAGGEVEWTNADSATHTVTSDDEGAFASEQLSEGDTFRQRFTEPGRYEYTCEIHPFMNGTVIVE